MLSTAAWNAFLKTLEEPPPEHRVRARHDRGAEGARDRRRSLPPLRLPAPHGRADRAGAAPHGRGRVDRDPARGDRRARALGHRELPRRARHARAAARLQRRRRSRWRTCSRCWASRTRRLLERTVDAIAAGDARGALLALAECADSGRDAGSFATDLEAQGARAAGRADARARSPPSWRSRPRPTRGCWPRPSACRTRRSCACWS